MKFIAVSERSKVASVIALIYYWKIVIENSIAPDVVDVRTTKKEITIRTK